MSRIPGIQVDITDGDDNPVSDPAIALDAMREMLGDPSYPATLIERVEEGVWLVALPIEDAQQLAANGFWGRENAGGYNVEAEWPTGAVLDLSAAIPTREETPAPAAEQPVAKHMLRVWVTSEQADALYAAAYGIVKTSPEAQEVAAFEAVMAAFWRAFPRS